MMRIIKRVNRIIALAVAVTMITGLNTTGAFAKASPLKAYNEAVLERDAAKTEYIMAKNTYDEAMTEFHRGSRGFYEWVRDNSTGWEKEDAEDALDLLEKSEFKKYTIIGGEDDTTNLDNMEHAVKLLPYLQKLRDNDENFEDLPPVSIRNIYMARAQMNANASSITGKHMLYLDSGYETNESSESLAWGTDNPFDLWYNLEKGNYNRLRKYIIRHYGYDINVLEEEDKFVNEHSDFNVIMRRFGEIGHYYTVMAGSICDTSVEPDVIDYEVTERAIFGLSYGQGQGTIYMAPCSCLTVDCSDQYDNSYSVDEYVSLFNRYYESVSKPGEKKAMNDAKAKFDKLKKEAKEKREALLKSLIIKIKASRKGNLVTLKWNKLRDVQKYEISVAGKKTTVKVLKRTKSNIVRIKVKGKKYIRVRAVTKNGKEVINGKWSKVIAV